MAPPHPYLTQHPLAAMTSSMTSAAFMFHQGQHSRMSVSGLHERASPYAFPAFHRMYPGAPGLKIPMPISPPQSAGAVPGGLPTSLPAPPPAHQRPLFTPSPFLPSISPPMTPSPLSSMAPSHYKSPSPQMYMRQTSPPLPIAKPTPKAAVPAVPGIPTLPSAMWPAPAPVAVSTLQVFTHLFNSVILS